MKLLLLHGGAHALVGTALVDVMVDDIFTDAEDTTAASAFICFDHCYFSCILSLTSIPDANTISFLYSPLPFSCNNFSFHWSTLSSLELSFSPLSFDSFDFEVFSLSTLTVLLHSSRPTLSPSHLNLESSTNFLHMSASKYYYVSASGQCVTSGIPSNLTLPDTSLDIHWSPRSNSGSSGTPGVGDGEAMIWKVGVFVFKGWRQDGWVSRGFDPFHNMAFTLSDATTCRARKPRLFDHRADCCNVPVRTTVGSLTSKLLAPCPSLWHFRARFYRRQTSQFGLSPKRHRLIIGFTSQFMGMLTMVVNFSWSFSCYCYRHGSCLSLVYTSKWRRLKFDLAFG